MRNLGAAAVTVIVLVECYWLAHLTGTDPNRMAVVAAVFGVVIGRMVRK